MSVPPSQLVLHLPDLAEDEVLHLGNVLLRGDLSQVLLLDSVFILLALSLGEPPLNAGLNLRFKMSQARRDVTVGINLVKTHLLVVG